MTIRFTKLSSAVWRSKRFRPLPASAKLLYLYLASNEHQTSIGAYRLPDGYALDDLGSNWTEKALNSARDLLVKAELIAFDEDASTYYLLRWFKHSPPMNASHAQGCRRLIDEIESDAIAERVQADFDEADALRVQSEAKKLGASTVADLSSRLGSKSGAKEWPVQRYGSR